MRGPSQQVVQAYLGFKMGLWSYNGAVKHWEPVVEPWDVIAQCAANYGSRVGVLTGPDISHCVGGWLPECVVCEGRVWRACTAVADPY